MGIHAVSFTGHRPQGLLMLSNHAKKLLRPLLRREVLEAVGRGCRTFYTGMAMGVDLIAAEEVLGVRKLVPDVRLIAVLPFAAQAGKYSADWATRYAEALAQADEQVLLAKEYHVGCYRERNRFLVEQAELVVAVYNGNPQSGTGQTIRLAERALKELHLYYPDEQGEWKSRIETVEIQQRFF